MRDVGALGESTLRTWAIQAEITSQKAEQDKTGWDFLLEFPLQFDSTINFNLPLDRAPYPLRCYIQVKSTDGQPGKWSVKLDNWMQFVNNPCPCFFLVFEFDSQNDCQRAHLVHIGQDYIRRVLRRLRELEVTLSDGDDLALHRKKLQFTYSLDDALPSLDGNGLAQAIRRHVSGSPEEYAIQKIALCQTVGYEEGTERLTFTIEPTEGYENIREYLVDFSLGLIPNINASYGELTDIRFGMASSRSKAIFDEGLTIEVERTSAGKGVLIFSTDDGINELRIDTETYVPHGFAVTDVNDEYFKIRFATQFIDFIVQRKGLRVKFDFKSPKATTEYLLRDIQSVCLLTQFLHQAEIDHKPVRISAIFKSHAIVSVTLHPTYSFSSDTIQYAICINAAWSIAKHFDIFQDLTVEPAELFHQHGVITFLHSLLDRQHFWMRIIFSAETRLAEEEKEVCAPYAMSASIGQYNIAVAIALIGIPTLTGNPVPRGKEFELRTDHVRLCRTFVYDCTEQVTYTEQEMKSLVIQEYEHQETYALLVV